MIGGVAVREAPDLTESFQLAANASNSSVVSKAEDFTVKRVQVAAVLTTLVGIIQVSGICLTLTSVYACRRPETRRNDSPTFSRSENTVDPKQ